VLILGGAIIIALIAADQRGWLLARATDDVAVFHGRRFRVTRIIDGDTIEIDRADPLNARAVTRVRLWGINCPELAIADRPEQPWAVVAAEHTEHAIGGNQILIWLESHQARDPFGAVLAHVELSDGQSLNELVLQAGLARADDRWPHQSLVRFAQLEAAAKRAGVGIWSSAPPSPP
jgi:endonuclease YncB( thermonuclease family)